MNDDHLEFYLCSKTHGSTCKKVQLNDGEGVHASGGGGRYATRHSGLTPESADAAECLAKTAYPGENGLHAHRGRFDWLPAMAISYYQENQFEIRSLGVSFDVYCSITYKNAIKINDFDGSHGRT